MAPTCSGADRLSAVGSRRDERHGGRVAALQLLYQREVGGVVGADLDAALERYWEEHPAPASRRAFAASLLRGTIADLERVIADVTGKIRSVLGFAGALQGANLPAPKSRWQGS